MVDFKVGIYEDPETGRRRWGVLDTRSNVWYFAKVYGKSHADKMCDRLNNPRRG